MSTLLACDFTARWIRSEIEISKRRGGVLDLGEEGRCCPIKLGSCPRVGIVYMSDEAMDGLLKSMFPFL